MSTEAQNLVATFNALPANDQHDAAVSILRATLKMDLGPLSDEALCLAAEELFLKLDRREASDGA